MNYNPKEIEAKWQQYWQENNIYKVKNDSRKPKFYALDMFPYPSGKGLHIGHPLGYIATDIMARYKKMKGYNVLHPMGFDSFGLPAEQYAVETGQHPAITTEQNIKTFKEQLGKIGFNYDWSREVQTSSPEFYKWTQWIFMQLFKSWYNNKTDKAEDIETLIQTFEKEGNQNIDASCSEDTPAFSAEEWKGFSEKEQQEILLKYRLTYVAEAVVNWCPALGMVLANDEVKDGLSERGGHPVERKKMRQWMMRLTAYTERLLQGLDKIDWSDALKEQQKNWIGKSFGAEIDFYLNPQPLLQMEKGSKIPPPQMEKESEAEKGSKIPPPQMGRGQGGGVLEKTFTTTPEKWKKLKEFARNNRKNPTEAENLLWQELRNKTLGHKFRRQHAVNDFIVDFICLEFNLIVEIDGDYHNEPEQQEFDEMRTQILNELGYKVIRFKNEEVTGNINEVLKKIKENLNPQPLLQMEKGSKIPPPQMEKESEAEKGSEIPPPQMEKGSKIPPPQMGRGQGGGVKLTVFTTRPDTIFGATFMVIAPEHELVESLTSAEQKQAVEKYVKQAKNRSDLERQSDVKTISGVFTGSYAINPFTEQQIPIWIADYVLAGYGTGAVMAVPEGDERDFRFATHFDLPIIPVKTTTKVDENGKVIEADPSKDGTMLNSGFMNGMNFKDAVQAVIKKAEEMGIGKGKVNYRLRDVPFSRQRYWGEPVPMYFKESLPYSIPESELPLNLPEITEYKPTETGEPPLGRAEDWTYQPHPLNPPPQMGRGQRGGVYPLELTTMPGWAGSSWYFLRYMDAQNKEEFASKKATDYWNQVDLYIGGSEHAVGHLLYSRFWTKFLFDKNLISFDEPFKKLINQGMIQGTSALVYRVAPRPPKGEQNSPTPLERGQGGEALFVSADLKDQYDTQELHVDISLVANDILDTDKFKNWREEYQNAEFILSEDGKFYCASRVEKMSKRWHNVVNPNEVVANYSADTLRLYEMFLGPLEQSKPWDPKNIDGSFRFLKKLWRLFFNENGEFDVSGQTPTKEEQKIIHQTIRKVEEDIERFSFNTPVSEFMKCVNELQKLKCNKQEILEKLLLIIAPYAVHIAEELWAKMGHTASIHLQEFPKWEEKYLKEDDFNYPIMINGKKRAMISFPIDKDKKEIEAEVLANEMVQKWTEGKTPKKVIIVPKKIVNVVL